VKTNTHFLPCVSEEICRENKITRIMFNKFSFFLVVLLWFNVEKYCRAGQATNNNMACAQYYRHTPRICNT